MSVDYPAKLLQLSPTAFENLIFDLLRLGELKNLVWRTPGSDGGRDLQGDHFEVDLSGQSRRSIWLIECKRYSSSVDWPTVWEKIAYGDSGGADYLLIAATNMFTPRCIDEVNKWNESRRMLKIRLWPVNEIVYQLEINPKVANKYGLSDGNKISANTFVDLALHVARISQSVSASALVGIPNILGSVVLAAVSELMYIRSSDLIETGNFKTNSFLQHESWPDFLEMRARHNLHYFDRFGLRAVLACLHFACKKSLIIEDDADGKLLVSSDVDLEPFVEKAKKLLDSVSFWGAIHIQRSGANLCLTRQILS